MKQLLIRADDLGYSHAIDLGIARIVHEGVVRSVGLMPNMPEAARGWSLLDGADIAVGQHTNLCLGKPCADTALIPSLLGPDGRFKRSREYHTAWAAGIEPIDFDEACIEIRAQHERFTQIVGREHARRRPTSSWTRPSARGSTPSTTCASSTTATFDGR